MEDSVVDRPIRTSPPPPQRRMLANVRVVSLLTLASRVLGLLRDTGMAALFGGSTIFDTFIVAFRIPNLTRQLFGEGALSTAFLPVFLQAQRDRGDDSARATMTAVALVLGGGLSALLLIAEAGLGLALWFGDFSDAPRLLVVLLMLLLPYMVVICLAALFCATLNALREFFWPASVPIILNFVWLAALAIVWKLPVPTERQAQLMAASVFIAGVLQMLLPLWVLRQYGMGPTPAWRAGMPHVATVFRTMLPVVAGLAVIQVSAVFDSLIAWSLSIPDDGSRAACELLGIRPFLESGTASALFLGQRLYQFPLGVFGVALGTVLYPLLTQHAQAGQMSELRRDLSKGLRLVIAVALPASVGLWVLSGPIATTLFRHGKFDADDAALTSRMIAIYGAGVWSYISLAIVNRAFYATGDRRTPLRMGLTALCVNLPLSLVLVTILGGAGLAVGSVSACILQVVLTTRRLDRQVGGLAWHELWPTLWKALVASAVMAAMCWLAMMWLPAPETTLRKLLFLGVPALSGFAVYWLMTRLLGLPEFEALLRRER